MVKSGSEFTPDTTPNLPPKKLLFVANAAWFFVSHRMPLAIAARAAGYEVHVAASHDVEAARLMDAGITFHSLSVMRGRGSIRENLRVVREMAMLYASLRPDLVHHVTIKPILYGGIAARRAGVPAVVNAISGLGYVFLDKGIRARLKRRAIGAFYWLALKHPNQVVIFQNPDDRSLFTRSGLVRRSETVLIRGSGVDVGKFHPAPRSAEIPTVILASRMLRDKGVVEFVDAARRLKERGLAARFVLVGDADPDNPSSMTTIELKAWDVEGVVEWWGHRADMVAVFRDADIVCLPSYREGLPKVLLEAAAAGLPIVATDVPGCREVVVDGRNGLLVPERDARALADALARLIENRELRERMGAESRALVIDGLTVDAVVQQTLTVYRQLLERP